MLFHGINPVQNGMNHGMPGLSDSFKQVTELALHGQTCCSKIFTHSRAFRLSASMVEKSLAPFRFR